MQGGEEEVGQEEEEEEEQAQEQEEIPTTDLTLGAAGQQQVTGPIAPAAARARLYAA
jgi:hypothetical protein